MPIQGDPFSKGERDHIKGNEALLKEFGAQYVVIDITIRDLTLVIGSLRLSSRTPVIVEDVNVLNRISEILDNFRTSILQIDPSLQGLFEYDCFKNWESE